MDVALEEGVVGGFETRGVIEIGTDRGGGDEGDGAPDQKARAGETAALDGGGGPVVRPSRPGERLTL